MKPIAAAIFLTALLGAPASADPFLNSLEGDWRGAGWLKRSGDGAKESLRCRLSFVTESDAKILKVSGRCAGGGNTGDVIGKVTSLSQGGYSADWRAGSSRPQAMTGRLSGQRLTFRWSTIGGGQGASGQISKGQAVWHLRGNRLTMTSRETGAAQTGSGGGSLQVDLKR